jgi:hypothetical protein
MTDKAQVKPTIQRTEHNIVSRAEALRDRIHRSFLDACEAEQVDALVLKSHPYSQTIWVKLECWLPPDNPSELRERNSVVLTLHPREFHRYEIEIEAAFVDGRRSYSLWFLEWNDHAAQQAVRHLLRRSGAASRRKVRLYLKKKRTSHYRIWQETNPVTWGRRDWVAIALIGLFVVPLLGFVFYGEQLSEEVAVSLFLLLLAGVTGLWLDGRRRQFVVSTGKPMQEPRDLVRLDSWQTLAFELAPRLEPIREAVKSEIREAQQAGFYQCDERIWYWGLDGIEERLQTVVTLRRAIAFLHLYAYGGDLYVGWDAHVNRGTWFEYGVGTLRVDPRTGSKIALKSVKVGQQPLTEYDVTDASCLIEWIHGAVTKVVKRELEEQKIDQEIDFSIQRGERKGLAGEEPRAGKKSLFSGLKLVRNG